MFYGLAEAESYFVNKVSVFVALAPVTKIPNTRAAVIQYAVDFYNELDDAFDLFGIDHLLGMNWLTNTTTKLFCNSMIEFCLLLEGLMATNDPDLDDADRYQVWLDHSPNGMSVRSLMIYAQNIKEDRFQVYAPDYNTFLSIG